MADGGDVQREALIDRFTTITGANSERAKFYLEAARWDLPLATNSFFEGDTHEMADGREGEERDPIEETGVGGDEMVPSQEEIPSPRLPPTKEKRTGIASMAEMQRRKREEEEGRARKEDDSQKFFAGGSEHSGQMISGPPRKKVDAKELASDVFAAAKSQGARGVEEEEREKMKERSKAFRGAGFRLGDTEAPSEQIGGPSSAKEPEKVMHTLTFWANGFCVDNGPLRTGNTPEDKMFLMSVTKGEIPQELVRSARARGGEVDVNIEDKRNEDYQPRAPKIVAFSGEGRKLGNMAPEVVSHASPHPTPSSPPSGSSSSAPPSVPLDPAQPTTTLQIRLADGTRLVAKFNPSHTVNDIRQFINVSRPAMSSAHYVLMTTFPNKELSDLGQSLADAKLLNAVVVQRMK